MQLKEINQGKYSRIGQVCAILTALVCALALLAQTPVLLVRTWLGVQDTLVSFAALAAFALLACGLFIHSTWPLARIGSWVACLDAVLVILLGTWNLLIAFGLDPMSSAFPGMVTAAWMRVGGEPAVQASLMVLAGLALLLVITNPSLWRWAHDLAISMITALLVANLMVVLAFYSGQFFRESQGVIPVKLPIALAFLALGVGLLASTDTSSRPIRSYLATTVLLVAGVLFSIAMFAMVERFERDQIVASFNQRSHGLNNALVRSIDSDLAQLDSLTSFYAATSIISRSEFSKFVSTSLAQHTSIRAFTWDAVVKDSDRANYEQAARLSGYSGFQFTEVDPGARLVVAPRRAEYVIAYYVEPYRSNEIVLGYNFDFDPERRAAMQIARDTGMRTVTNPIQLIRPGDKGLGVLVFQPVYNAVMTMRTVKDRRENLLGYLSGTFNVRDMIALAVKSIDQNGITLNVYDSTDETKPVLLYSNRAAEKVVDNQLYWVDNFPVANRQWSFECFSNTPLTSTQRTWQAWAVLIAGILLTTILGTYTLTTARRTDEIHKAQEALRDSELQFRAVVELANDAIISADGRGNIVSWNRGAQKMFGYETGEVLGKPLTMLIPTRYQNTYRIGMDWVATIDRVPMLGKTFELDGLRKDGKEFPMEFTFSTYRVHSDVYISGILRDISERREAESKLRYLSTHDALTGLFNRAVFEAEIERLEHSRRFPVSIIVGDVDDFKRINDNFGHEAGDRALRCAAEVLRAPFRGEDLVARVGGDEFAILLPDVDYDIAEQTLDRIRQEQMAHNMTEGHTPVSISLGTYTAEVGESIMNAYNQADLRMYADKSLNKRKIRQN